MRKYDDVAGAEADANANHVRMRMRADDYNALLPMIWLLLGNHGIVPAVRDTLGGVAVTPSRHSWVVAFVDDVVGRTRLTPAELARLLGDIDVRPDRRTTCTSVLSLIVSRARDMPFEPSWHQGIRGDTRPLSSEAWSRIRDVHMDRIPTKHMRVEGMGVRQARKTHKRYAKMLEAAYKASTLRQDEANAMYDSMGNRIVGHDASRRRFA